MKELSQKELFIFYRFCTGLTRVPINGFKALQGTRNKVESFCIDQFNTPTNTNNNEPSKKRLIEANTCFNRIYLPEVNTKEEMIKIVKIIVENDTNYFGNL